MRAGALFGLALVALLPSGTVDAARRAPAKDPPPEQAIREAAPILLGRALASPRPMLRLQELCDDIGPRLSGSPELDRAIAWAQGALRADGLTAVRAEPVTVQRWVRGEESAELLEPVRRPMRILGLGGTVATPEEGVEGEVVVVESFEQLAALPRERVEGRIVVYDVPFTTYGATRPYRSHGASRAAEQGAIAALVRSVTPESLATPHTGGMSYAEGGPRIPTAAITVEDASLFRRLAARGVPARVRLKLGARWDGDASSANVVGEVPGRSKPEELVVLACHLDSWDVGTGAQDDGAGCVVAMEAARLIGELPLRPRRTVRVVLYTNEENGGAGGATYAETHEGALDRHAGAIESDTGAGEPLGYRVDLRVPEGPEAEAQAAARTARAMEDLALLRELLEPLGATAFEAGGAGADVTPLARAGVPALGLSHDMTGYWPIHHTEADTIDKIDEQALRRNVASMALAAYFLAEIEGRIGD